MRRLVSRFECRDPITHVRAVSQLRRGTHSRNTEWLSRPQSCAGARSTLADARRGQRYPGARRDNSGKFPRSPGRWHDGRSGLAVSTSICCFASAAMEHSGGPRRPSAEIARRQHKIAVVGIPKTIDNDIRFCDRRIRHGDGRRKRRPRFLPSLTTRPSRPFAGLGLVKLMGRQAGFIACGAVGQPGCQLLFHP